MRVLPFLILAFVAGCATTRLPTNDEARVVVDAPESFLFEGRAAAGVCRSPAIDPLNRARYALVRSSDGFGDYELPEGRFGATRDELLRMDCTTGRTVGFVRR